MNDTAGFQETVLFASNPKLNGIANMTAGAQNETLNALLTDLNLSQQKIEEIKRINEIHQKRLEKQQKKAQDDQNLLISGKSASIKDSVLSS